MIRKGEEGAKPLVPTLSPPASVSTLFLSLLPSRELVGFPADWKREQPSQHPFANRCAAAGAPYLKWSFVAFFTPPTNRSCGGKYAYVLVKSTEYEVNKKFSCPCFRPFVSLLFLSESIAHSRHVATEWRPHHHFGSAGTF